MVLWIVSRTAWHDRGIRTFPITTGSLIYLSTRTEMTMMVV